MKNLNKQFLFSFCALVIFALIALAYNSPILSGKAISQPDIVNFRGSAQEMIEFQDKTNEPVYWSDAMFGGMPTYQTGASYTHNWIKKADEVLRFLPRPADYVFLYFLGFYFLGIVVFRNWKYAFLGALLFGMGTYFFIILEAGHNSKAHAIAYFAPLAASIILLYRKKYILGFLLTTFFMALQLVTNHPQMTYYFGFAMILFVIFEAIEKIKQKEILAFIKSSALALFAIILALGMNSESLLATYEYGQESIRGKNDVTLLENKNPDGLDKDYITNWSYGKLETLNLFIPNFMGGGSVGTDDYKTNLKSAIEKNVQSQEEYQYYIQAVNYLPTYWGTQPFTSGPAYQGAVVVFLFLLGLFFVRGKYKWWLLSTTLLSITLAWGKNFNALTDFFINNIPLYDKFRAVSSILVVAEFAMPFLAVLAVYRFFTDEKLTEEFKKKILIYGGGGFVAVMLLMYFIGGGFFGFETVVDRQFPQFMQEAIKKDRIAMYQADLLRSLAFVVASLLLFITYHFKIIKSKEIVIFGIALLTFIDLLGVDKRYLNEENYIPKQLVEHPFPVEMTDRLYQEAQSNPTIMQIAYKIPQNKLLKDLADSDNSHFRVYNAASSTFNDASTSFFVSSVGGYHGAKLQSYQNIIDIYFSQDSVLENRLGVAGKGQKVLNLLNTKYFVVQGQNGLETIQNPEAKGNAWFVRHLKEAKSANDAIIDISKINIDSTAVVENISPKSIANENGEIILKTYAPDNLVYESQNNADGFAVFSEIFYDKGWKAFIDGKEAEIVKTNYFLRGLYIPKGKHEIVFKFQPEIIKTGSIVALSSNIVFIILLIGGLFLFWKGFNVKN